MKVLSVLSSLVAFGVSTCDVSDNKVNVFSHTVFTNELAKTVLPAQLVEGGKIQLTDKDGRGVASHAWLYEDERVSDGFEAIYKFTVDGEGDGFTFVVQNDRIEDLILRSGPFAGFYGIKNSLAVKLLICPTQPCQGTDFPTLSVITVNGTLHEEVNTQVDLSKKLNDNTEHEIKVLYSQYGESISVSLDGEPVAGLENVDIGNLMDILDSRFARMGFTASTSWNYFATQQINSLELNLLPSNTIVLDVANTKEVEWNTKAEFKLSFRDACLKQLPNSVPGAIDTIEAKLVQKLEDGETNQIIIPLEKQDIIDNKDGSYSMPFLLPEFYKATFDLHVDVDSVPADGSPYPAVVTSIQPDNTVAGFPPEIFAILLILIVIILFLITYAIYRLYKYRKQLLENEEYIKAGQEQARLDKLDDGVQYQENPMVQSIDELKMQLARNKEELARLKARDPGEDDEYTLSQLQEQRDMLLAEFNRLKRQEQEDAASKSTFTQQSAGALGRKRREFNPEQTNEEF